MFELHAGTRWYRLYVITIQAFLLDNATHSINSLYTPVKKNKPNKHYKKVMEN